MGVDALRLDAIPYLIEREGTINENLPETHDLLKTIRRELDARFEGRVLLAEANQWPSDVRAYFGDGDECQMCFHFPLMPRMFMARAAGGAPSDRRDHEPDAGDSRELPVGDLPAQSRRADAGDGHRRGARLHVCAIRGRPADAAEPRHPAASRPVDGEQPAAASS